MSYIANGNLLGSGSANHTINPTLNLFNSDIGTQRASFPAHMVRNVALKQVLQGFFDGNGQFKTLAGGLDSAFRMSRFASR